MKQLKIKDEFTVNIIDTDTGKVIDTLQSIPNFPEEDKEEERGETEDVV